MSYRVERVVVAEKVLVVRYTTQSEPNATAKFACPLILSVAKGDYDHVQFVEDGKEIQSVAIQPALPVAIKSREADTVTATVEKERTLLVIKGGSGIGQATVRCLAPAWPPGHCRARLSGRAWNNSPFRMAESNWRRRS